MRHSIALLALAASAASAASAQGTIEKVVLAPDIYLFRAPESLDNWASTNSVVIVNQNDVTVFDNNSRPSTSRLVIAEIRKITNKPVRTLINSHWHMDHWFGNEEYAKAFPGLAIVATTDTRNYMARMPIPYFQNQLGAARRRARLDTAIMTGKLADGSPLTPERRRELERDAALSAEVTIEVGAMKQVLPTHAFSDSLVLWSGDREFRLFSVTGDATGSAVLYLPREKVLMTGDVVVRDEEGRGGQPWTMNSYKVADWLASLRRLDALDVAVLVPGQGPAQRDKVFLQNTIAMYDAIITQVHAALEKGAFRLDQVQAAIDLRSIRTRMTGDDPALNTRFDAVAAGLIRRAYQDAHDGIATP